MQTDEVAGEEDGWRRAAEAENRGVVKEERRGT